MSSSAEDHQDDISICDTDDEKLQQLLSKEQELVLRLDELNEEILNLEKKISPRTGGDNNIVDLNDDGIIFLLIESFM